MNIIDHIVIGFLPSLGVPELMIILFVLLLLFGSRKLPELAKGMGKAINEFKRASSDIEKDIKKSMDETPDLDKKDGLKSDSQKPDQN